MYFSQPYTFLIKASETVFSMCREYQFQRIQKSFYPIHKFLETVNKLYSSKKWKGTNQGADEVKDLWYSPDWSDPCLRKMWQGPLYINSIFPVRTCLKNYLQSLIIKTKKNQLVNWKRRLQSKKCGKDRKTVEKDNFCKLWLEQLNTEKIHQEEDIFAG